MNFYEYTRAIQIQINVKIKLKLFHYDITSLDLKNLKICKIFKIYLKIKP